MESLRSRSIVSFLFRQLPLLRREKFFTLPFLPTAQWKRTRKRESRILSANKGVFFTLFHHG